MLPEEVGAPITAPCLLGGDAAPVENLVAAAPDDDSTEQDEEDLRNTRTRVPVASPPASTSWETLSSPFPRQAPKYLPGSRTESPQGFWVRKNCIVLTTYAIADAK